MSDLFDVFFRDFFNTDSGFNRIGGSGRTYPYAVRKDESAIYIELPAIGAKKEDIEITTKGEHVTVEYRKNEKDKKEYLYNGIARRDFKLSWLLPENCDTSKIEGELSEGLLTIKVPYSEETKPKKIELK